MFFRVKFGYTLKFVKFSRGRTPAEPTLSERHFGDACTEILKACNVEVSATDASKVWHGLGM